MLLQVSNEAYRCLNAALGKYDPFKCLAVCPEHSLINNKLLHYHLLQCATYTSWIFFACAAGYCAFVGKQR
jgi:hypothetical protein